MTDDGAPLPAARPQPTHPVARPPSAVAAAWAQAWSDRSPAPAFALGAVATIGLLGGWLVVGHRPGIGVAVVGLLVAAPAVPPMARRHAVGDLVLLALAVALTGVAALRDAGWVVALALVAAAGVGATALTSARSAPAVLLAGPGWGVGMLRSLGWVRRGLGALAGTHRGQVARLLRSVAVTVGLLVVFGALFAGADAVFASYLPRLEADLLPGQVVVGLLIAVAAAASAHLALVPPTWGELRPAAPEPARRGEWLLPVLALDVLVLAFVGVQVGALVGGHSYVLSTAGLGYAQYAREGFAQLVAATALTLVVVAVAARRAPRRTAVDRLVSRVALGVLCLATLGVVASALRRMDLYVEAYGLTRLRLVVVVAEVAMAVLLVVVMVAGARWRGTWVPRAGVVVVAVAILALAAVNPDDLIARHNTTADLDVPLDVSYLQGLSADADPALAQTAEPWRSRLLTCQDLATDDPWQAWNLGRSRALAFCPTAD